MEGEALKAGIEEEVEGIDGFEVGDEVNLHREFRRRASEEHIGLLVLVGIEPPLEYAAGGNDIQLILEDLGSAVESRTKLNGLGADEDRSLILIVGPVVERDFHSHITLLSAPS